MSPTASLDVFREEKVLYPSKKSNTRPLKPQSVHFPDYAVLASKLTMHVLYFIARYCAYQMLKFISVNI
jgi:hypothetical protein